MTMWEKIKAICASCFLVGTSGALLFMLCAIERYGELCWDEPNEWMLRSEIGLLSLVFIFAIERFWRATRDD